MHIDMEYNFRDIEQKWQKRWVEMKTYRVTEDPTKKKFYVLNMFPYPSGAGLHVGHPLGYIASDIYARYKRQQGYNVLNPMGYDAYGLPAEQYAIQTGQHPEKTTFENIDRYRSQLDKIGFSFDWDREVRTCDPIYYKWTQWAFQRMFKSYYSLSSHKAQPTIKLIEHFELMGTENCNALGTEELHFTASDWAGFTEKKKQEVLMNYRIAYLADTMVNWCPKLGTVLANDEVVDGVSVRGGYPVVQKKMRQWCLRVSAYAQRLLDGLEDIDWTDSLKETQRNWIGRSEGTEVEFKVADSDKHFTIFTTRADTMFGVTFMVLAPESDLVAELTTDAQKAEVEKYLDYVKKRTERDRQMDHKVTGVFSGSYAINPFTDEKIPIWIAEYVLAGYGTGAIMAVPAHDSRDYAFAKHFNLPIIPLIEGADVSNVSAIEWLTWHGAGVNTYSCTYQGRAIDYWDVYNPYRCLTLDTAKMPIGKILKIHVEVVKSNHDLEVPVVDVRETRNAYNLYNASAGVGGRFVVEMDRQNMPTASGATGSLTLQLASGYYPTLPDGVSENDTVFILEYGGAIGLAVFSSTSGECPRVPSDGSATTLQCTVTTDADGYIVVKFTATNRNGASRNYTWKIPSNALTGVAITPSEREINFRRYEPQIQGTSLNYHWVNDPHPFRIYAPLAGPRFYWPYLMARSDGGGHGASELALRFRKVRDYTSKIDYGDDYGSENISYVPEEPHYESVVYMCRIDNDHVLVLGY